MKIFLTALAVLLVQTTAFAGIVKSNDRTNGCTLYEAVSHDDQGRVIVKPGQTVISKKVVYGLSFMNMEVDFNHNEVLVDLMMNVTLGFDKALLPQKVAITETNPEFNFLVNQLNRKVSLFEKVCINSQNEVTYAKFPQKN